MAKIDVKRNVLEENNRLAEQLRDRFSASKTVVLNLVSSPGAGKTTLLEHTLRDTGHDLAVAVVAGDVQTENDADRLKAAGGTRIKSIVTGGACHLDARMVHAAVEQMDLTGLDLLIIENVGNLVCPSSYDLGEDRKVVLVSVTEGDDKPLKYPGMFRRSSTLVVTKTDLLPHCDFSVESVQANARQINGSIETLELCCQTGEGLGRWYDWLRRCIVQKRGL